MAPSLLKTTNQWLWNGALRLRKWKFPFVKWNYGDLAALWTQIHEPSMMFWWKWWEFFIDLGSCRQDIQKFFKWSYWKFLEWGEWGGGAEAIPGNDEGTKNDIFAPNISQSVFNAVWRKLQHITYKPTTYITKSYQTATYNVKLNSAFKPPLQ